MDLEWFVGQSGQAPPPAPVQFKSIPKTLFGPEHYEAEPGLVDAVNVALLLGQPLLLTGEPGTGKTQLADKLAIELGLGEAFRFETKSTSVAQDLFYYFDHLSRLHAAQDQGARTPSLGSDSNDHARQSTDPLRFIDYQALGRAILCSMPEEAARTWFAGGVLPAWYSVQRRAVVLIDEVDKAPSDFPNDVLNEIERNFFRVRELGNRTAEAAPGFEPVVLLTSNSEKQLPDAFLRRCIFYHLSEITPERLDRIVLNRLQALKVSGGPGRLYLASRDFFFELRDSVNDLRKRPSTAEFLQFLSVLMRHGAKADAALPKDLAMRALGVLVKTPEDQDSAARLLGRHSGA